MLPNIDAAEITPDAQPEDHRDQPAPDEGAAQDAAPQSKVVTEEVLEQRLTRHAEEILKRASQSNRALIKNQLAQYDRMVKVQESTGTPISPEAQSAARNKIIMDSVTGEGEEAGQAPTPNAGQARLDNETWGAIVSEQVAETFAEVGVEVKPGEPEWAPIDACVKSRPTLAKLLRVVAKSAEAKKDRLASEQDTAEARVGGGGGKGPAKKALSPEEKLSAGLRGGDWNRQPPEKRT